MYILLFLYAYYLFHEGRDVLIKFGVVLLKGTLSKTITEKTTLDETLDFLEDMPSSVTDEDALVSKVKLILTDYIRQY